MNALGAVLCTLADTWPPQLMYRWLLAYWYFDSCGLASWLALRIDHGYALSLSAAAKNKTRCPVGTEWPHRREFDAQTAVADLRDIFGDRPEDMVRTIRNVAPDREVMLLRAVNYTGVTRAHANEMVALLDQIFTLNVQPAPTGRILSEQAVRKDLAPWRKHTTLARQLYTLLETYAIASAENPYIAMLSFRETEDTRIPENKK